MAIFKKRILKEFKKTAPDHHLTRSAIRADSSFYPVLSVIKPDRPVPGPLVHVAILRVILP